MLFWRILPFDWIDLRGSLEGLVCFCYLSFHVYHLSPKRISNCFRKASLWAVQRWRTSDDLGDSDMVLLAVCLFPWCENNRSGGYFGKQNWWKTAISKTSSSIPILRPCSKQSNAVRDWNSRSVVIEVRMWFSTNVKWYCILKFKIFVPDFSKYPFIPG